MDSSSDKKLLSKFCENYNFEKNEKEKSNLVKIGKKDNSLHPEKRNPAIVLIKSQIGGLKSGLFECKKILSLFYEKETFANLNIYVVDIPLSETNTETEIAQTIIGMIENLVNLTIQGFKENRISKESKLFFFHKDCFGMNKFLLKSILPLRQNEKEFYFFNPKRKNFDYFFKQSPENLLSIGEIKRKIKLFGKFFKSCQISHLEKIRYIKKVIEYSINEKCLSNELMISFVDLSSDVKNHREFIYKHFSNKRQSLLTDHKIFKLKAKEHLIKQEKPRSHFVIHILTDIRIIKEKVKVMWNTSIFSGGIFYISNQYKILDMSIIEKYFDYQNLKSSSPICQLVLYSVSKANQQIFEALLAKVCKSIKV